MGRSERQPRVDALAEPFRVATQTIRRDIDTRRNASVQRRGHGGARRLSPSAPPPMPHRPCTALPLTRLALTAAIVAACVFGAFAPTAVNAAPLIVAHRGGTGDTPENTVQAFTNALHNGAQALWMTVQVTRDGVPVMYRPADLSALTNGRGKLADIDYADVKTLNAGYAFSRKDASGQTVYPYRDHPLPIPTLREALAAVPANVPVLLDMKQTPAAPLVEAVIKVLDETNAWSRVRLYSTEAEATDRMRARRPQAQLFESRDATRNRLVAAALAGQCTAPPASGTWAGIELHRQVEVVERFTLGEGVSKVVANWWTPAAVQCFKSHPDVHLVAFGVETPQDFEAASQLGFDAVMTDSPARLRAALDKPGKDAAK